MSVQLPSLSTIPRIPRACPSIFLRRESISFLFSSVKDEACISLSPFTDAIRYEQDGILLIQFYPPDNQGRIVPVLFNEVRLLLFSIYLHTSLYNVSVIESGAIKCHSSLSIGWKTLPFLE